MKCPYNHGKVTECIQQTHDENGFLVQQMTITMRQLMECAKEECGAWQDGRCNYNQDHNYQ